ncbi:MAG: (Fe-S)-binding protein [Alphaproteobacteria bacterium]
MNDKNSSKPHVGLFVTCLVDSFRPNVGFSSIDLLEKAGCTVSVPTDQVCCGQPAFNSGNPKEAKAIARQVIDLFEDFDYVVVPSGSCGGMLNHHLPTLMKDDQEYAQKAKDLAAKTYELLFFLYRVRGLKSLEDGQAMTITYHDSCSSLREHGVRIEPRELVQSMKNGTVIEHETRDVCCGFGGAFCVKYSDISTTMVEKKCNSLAQTGASVVAAGDMGCLLNIAGRLKKNGSNMRAYHIAEILAERTDVPAIGEGKND